MFASSRGQLKRLKGWLPTYRERPGLPRGRPMHDWETIGNAASPASDKFFDFQAKAQKSDSSY